MLEILLNNFNFITKYALVGLGVNIYCFNIVGLLKKYNVHYFSYLYAFRLSWLITMFFITIYDSSSLQHLLYDIGRFLIK